MANDLLIDAIRKAGLTNDQVADRCGVDPKTVSRWISGRVPHPRYRSILTRELGVAEDEIWPDAARRRGRADLEEITGAWARRSDASVPDWRALLKAATTQVDLLGYSLASVLGARGALPAIERAAASGVRVRICVADPDADFVLAAGLAQRSAGRLPERVRATIERLSELEQHAALVVRRHAIATVHTILRFDDTMLLTIHLHGIPGFDASALQLQRRRDYGIFDQLAGHFEAVWASATPLPARGPTAAATRPAPTVSGADALLDRLEERWRPR